MKNDEIKQQNHDKIKATASVLFFINGIEATNMYQIAAASGISKVSLYKYYESKYDIARDLIFDALEDTSRRFKEKWKVVPDETGAQELKRLL
ncbi:MAG: TetR/AcrR family transcriptional regulator [Firmicutes bacterium]|nr:TetR/AcrR family transcriptional regulator [Bacillota bacterium]